MTDPHTYIDDVADALRAAGVIVEYPYAQTRESRYTDAEVYEGAIQIGDGNHPDDPDLPDPDPASLAWDQEDGWRLLSGGQHGAYNRVRELDLPIDADPADVVTVALALPGIKPDNA